MKKYLFLLLSYLFIIHQNNAQEYYPGDDGSRTIYIPVVFHIVTNHNGRDLVTEEDLHKIIDVVNKGFNDVDRDRIEPIYRHLVVPSNIHFYIPQFAYDENGNIKPSISYHQLYGNAHFHSYEKINKDKQVPYDHDLKKHGYINSRKYLNVWITNLDGNSYSTLPFEKNKLNDGIVLSSQIFIDSILNKYYGLLPQDFVIYKGMVLTHEIGHWLGLYHIWGNFDPQDNSNIGCIPNYALINYVTDSVDDTPRQRTVNVFNFYGENRDKMLKVCFKNQISNYQNFMDGAYNVGMFTEGQIKRMRWHIYTYRPELLYNTGPDGMITGDNESNTGNDDYSQNNDNVPTTGYNDNYPINYDKKYMYFNIPPEYDYDVHFTGFGVQDFNNVVLPNNTKNYLSYGRYLVEIYDKQKRAVAELIFDFYHGTDNIVFETSQDGCIFWRYEGDDQIRKFNYLPDYFHCRNVDPYFTSQQRTSQNSEQVSGQHASDKTSQNLSSENTSRPSGQSGDNTQYSAKPAPSVSGTKKSGKIYANPQPGTTRRAPGTSSTRIPQTRRTPLRINGNTRHSNPVNSASPARDRIRTHTRTRSLDNRSITNSRVRTTPPAHTRTVRPSPGRTRRSITPANGRAIRNTSRSTSRATRTSGHTPVRTIRTRTVPNRTSRTRPAGTNTRTTRPATRRSGSVSPLRGYSGRRNLRNTTPGRSSGSSSGRKSSTSSGNDTKKRKTIRRLSGALR